MAEQIVGLSEHDVKVLKELIASVRTRPLNTAGRTFTDDPPDTIAASYIIKTPSAGIPARAGAGVSAATCRVYQRVDSDLVDAGFDRTVYNATGAAIDGNIYTTATRDPWGTLWADDVAGTGTTSGGSGITSINDSTTLSQTIGLGTAGADINITTTAAAYSGGVTYSRGMLASSGGSTYRYSNATPTAGNAPPNATYWVDVTGDGLTIINVPDASATADGLVNTGTQTIVGFKTFAHVFGTRFTDAFGNNGYIELGDADVDGAFFTYTSTGDHLAIYAGADTTRGALIKLHIGSQFATWNNATAYVVGDKVNYSGYGYNCLVNNTNKLPSINPTEWELLPSSYPDTDRPRLTLSGGNTADASSTTAGSKPYFEIEDAGNIKRGQTGTNGGGDEVTGGIGTGLGTPPTGATVGYTPGNSADWSGDPTDVAAALNRLAAAVAGLLGTAVP